jgi:choline-glycine betaine transporter
MILRIVNTVLAFLTRPYFYIQQYFLLTFQSVLPTHFDEKSWYILFGFMTFLVFVIAYVLSRCITIQDADDNPVYQRARFYSMQRQHRKTT